MPTTYYFNEVTLNWWFNNNVNADTPPATVYFGLLMEAPSQDGTGVVEPSDVDYDRQSVDFELAVNEQAEWVASPTFDVDGSYEPWGWGYWDASTAGELLAYNQWTEAVFVSAPTFTPPRSLVKIS